MQSRYIIDPITDISDNVPGFFQSENQALFLARFNLGKNIDFTGLPHERGVAHPLNVAPGKDLLRIETNLLCQMCCDQRIVASNNLQSNAEIAQFAQRRFDTRFRRIRQRDEPDENHPGFGLVIDA